MWDLPDPEIKLTSPPLAGGFFTTEPPGKLSDWESLDIQNRDTALPVVSPHLDGVGLEVQQTLVNSEERRRSNTTSFVESSLGRASWLCFPSAVSPFLVSPLPLEE